MMMMITMDWRTELKILFVIMLAMIAMLVIVGIAKKAVAAYPDGYYTNGYPNELIDDDLNESEEIADEKLHIEESEEWDNNSWTKLK